MASTSLSASTDLTILDELTAYAHDCISGKIPSCQKHINACKRFLSDISRSRRSWRYVWDEKQARKIVTWFTYLRHSKGVLSGKPIYLTVQQKFFVCQIYGWREKDTGYKRFTTAFLMIGRKNAKSQMEAGCLLYEMAVESTRFGELYETYCAGVKRDQSKIIFDECRLMLRGSPLARKFRITRDKITHIKSESFLRPLSKEDGKSGDGTNPACLVLDEYHQHPNTDFYDLALGGNSGQAMLIIITTAGRDLTSPCYTQEYKYASDLLSPDVGIENDRYLADIFESDVKDFEKLSDTVLLRQELIKSNPLRMSYPEGESKIMEAYKIAWDIPEKMTAFLTKVLNIWVTGRDGRYMDIAKWKKCEVGKLPIEIKDLSVYVGFDMSAKIDLTSVAFVIPFQSEGKVRYIVFSHSFIPNREKLAERIRTDRAPYDLWERQGYITVTDTPIVDQNAVKAYVADFLKKHGLAAEMMCFDPANASKMEMELSDEGYRVEEVFQSHRSLNESTAGFREEVYSGNVIFLANPVLTYAMSNAVVRTSNGLIKIDKDSSPRRIDPVDAVLCAFKLAMYHEFGNAESVEDWLDKEW